MKLWAGTGCCSLDVIECPALPRDRIHSARVRADLAEVLMFGRALVSPARAQLIQERARIMRFSPTRSEDWLWRRLSGSKTGFAFRRQLVIGEHIVDFA